MAFMGILLLSLGLLAFILAIIGFEIATICLSIVFLVLAIIMFVIAKKRKDAGKRMVPFTPIAITSTVVSGSLDAVWITILVIFLVFVNTPPAGYVDTKRIDETGDISKSFHVDGVEYKLFEPCGSVFNNNAMLAAVEPVFSYCPSSKLDWKNFNRLPNAGKDHEFDIVKDGKSHLCYVRYNQYSEANDYYSRVIDNDDTIFLLENSDNEALIQEKNYSFIRSHLYELKNQNYSVDDAATFDKIDTYLSFELTARTSDNYFDKNYYKLDFINGKWYLDGATHHFLLSSEFQNILSETLEIK